MGQTVSLGRLVENALARGGFVTEGEVSFLAEHDRLRPLLVRCGGCRFTAPAQDVAHLVAIITRDGQEYVRDVSMTEVQPVKCCETHNRALAYIENTANGDPWVCVECLLSLARDMALRLDAVVDRGPRCDGCGRSVPLCLCQPVGDEQG